MKNKNLFPLIEPDGAFKERLKEEVLAAYKAQNRPSFNWRWLIAPAFALGSFLLLILANGKSGFAPFSAIDKSALVSRIVDDKKGQGWEGLAEMIAPASLEEIDEDLGEVLVEIEEDQELKGAIAFSNL